MEKVITLELLKKYNAKLVKDSPLLERNTAYTVGDVVKESGKTLKCITAGTTKIDTLNLSSASIGSTVTDGTVTWTVINPYESITEWKSGNTYTEGQLVLHDGAIYKSIKQNNNTSFSKNNFELAVYNTKIQPITNEFIDTLFEGLQ